MQKIYGFGLVLISAVAFGAMPIFARFAYAAGSDPISLLFFRFLIGALCMVALLLIKGASFPRGRVLMILVLMGMLGYAGQSFCYFTALTLIPAGLVAILLYLYPIMVMILSVLFFKEKVSAGKLLALILALSGTVLVIGVQIGGSPVGIAWGLGAAMIYSLYIVTGATVLRGTEPLTASMVIMAGAAFSLALMTFVQGIHLPRTASGWIWVICIGVLCTAIAISLFFGGMKVIGAVDASLVSTFEPVTTVVLAFALLEEGIGAFQLVGMGLILSAATLLALRPPMSPLERQTDKSPKP
jgi:drug/metabolite transporter (DMT)-like permease